MLSISEVVEAEVSASAAVKDLTEQLTTLASQIGAISESAERLRGSFFSEDVLELIEAPEETRIRSEQLTELDRRLAELLSQAAAAENRLEHARAALLDATRMKVETVVARVSEIRAEDIADIRDHLAEIATHAASLIISDIVMDRVVGDQLERSRRNGAQALSGRELATQLLDALTQLPDQLRPSALDAHQIEQQALWLAESTESLAPEYSDFRRTETLH